jgi:hypothetical protein
MNTLDAIIALTVLICGIGLLVSTIINENETFMSISKITQTKTESLICATIIDSIYSNTGKSYSKDITCLPESNKLISKNGAIQKETYSITTAEKKIKIEVKILEHYFE